MHNRNLCLSHALTWETFNALTWETFTGLYWPRSSKIWSAEQNACAPILTWSCCGTENGALTSSTLTGWDGMRTGAADAAGAETATAPAGCCTEAASVACCSCSPAGRCAAETGAAAAACCCAAVTSCTYKKWYIKYYFLTRGDTNQRERLKCTFCVCLDVKFHTLDPNK